MNSIIQIFLCLLVIRKDQKRLRIKRVLPDSLGCFSRLRHVAALSVHRYINRYQPQAVVGTLCTAVKRRHSITEIRTWLIEFFVQFTDSLYSCLIKTSLILVNNSDWNQRELSRAPGSFASAVFSLRSELPLMKRLFNRIRELYAWVTRLNDIELSSLSSCCMFVAFFHYRLSNTTRSNMEYHNMAGVLFTSICRRSTEFI